MKKIKKLCSFIDFFLVLLGIIFVIRPEMTLEIIAYCIGVLLITYGVIKVLCYFSNDRYQLAFQHDLAMGIVFVILGIFFFVKTKKMIDILGVGIGIVLLIEAASRLQTSIEAKRFGIEEWKKILAISISLTIMGILLIITSDKAYIWTIRLIGIDLILDGIMNYIVVKDTVNMVDLLTED